MYEAFWQHSEFIRANIIVKEDMEGILDGYHERVNGINMVYQVAQLYFTNNQTELKTFPLPEKAVKKLQISPEELQKLAIANMKRFSVSQREAVMLGQPSRRRFNGR